MSRRDYTFLDPEITSPDREGGGITPALTLRSGGMQSRYNLVGRIFPVPMYFLLTMRNPSYILFVVYKVLSDWKNGVFNQERYK